MPSFLRFRSLANLLLRFPELFTAIENEIGVKGPLGIDSYGVSMTTLEEIFLQLGEEEEAKKEEKEFNAKQGEGKKKKKGKKVSCDDGSCKTGCIIYMLTGWERLFVELILLQSMYFRTTVSVL